MTESRGRSGPSGIVLAGGRSSRFGRDKLVEPVRGVPLVHHAVRALGQVCSEILVITAAHRRPPPLPGDLSVPVRAIPDREVYPGPLAALAEGLEFAGQPLALVVGGDMPSLPTSVLRLLIEALDDGDAEVACLIDDGEARPLPLAIRTYHRRTARALLDEGNASLGGLLASLPVTPIAEKSWRALDPLGYALFDVDRPQDLPG
jgi:molybdenum cofactor guanylyltransferase